MSDQYSVAKQVVVRIPLGEKQPPFEGRLTRIEQPLASFAVAGDAPPSPGEVEFEFLLHGLPLMAGRGRLEPDGTAGEGDALWRVTEVRIQDGDSSQAARLALLLPPEQRARYLAGAAKPGAADFASRWVDFHSRAILLLDQLAQINSEMDPQALLLSIMEAAQKVMEAEASSLMLLDSASGELEVQVPTGPARSEISGVRIPKGKGFGGWVVLQGQPLIVDSPRDDPRFYGEIAGSGFQTRNLICVPLASGSGEVVGVLQAMNKLGGGSFQADEIPLFEALAQQAAIALERGRLVQESIRRQVLESELNLASEIQSGFWPRRLPALPGFGLAGSSRPAAHVGGDYYDVIQLENGQVGLVVADVSGKGVPAALLMAALRSSLRTQLENHHAPAEAVSRVNNALVEDTPTAKFVTLFYGVLDPSSRRLTYVNAGHNPPLLLRKGGEMERLEVGGAIVGFQQHLPYESGRVQLEAGDRLVLFSDGITEAGNEEDEMYGDDRLEALLRDHARDDAESLMKGILQEVAAFAGRAPQADDMTLLVLTLE